MINHPLNGSQYLLYGFKLIFKPGMKRFIIIPAMINCILFISLFLLSRHWFGEFNTWVLAHMPTWLQWLGGILWLVFFAGFVLVMLYSFVTLSNLILAPFNNLLAEKVEFMLTGKSPVNQSMVSLLKDIPRVIGRQFAIIGYYLPRAMGILILFFVPVIQIFAAGIWFLFNAWFMTLQYMDYPTDNHRIPFEKVRDALQRKRFLSLSFGVTVLLFTMIPILNFIVMPAAVAGATAFWLKEYEKTH